MRPDYDRLADPDLHLHGGKEGRPFSQRGQIIRRELR